MTPLAKAGIQMYILTGYDNITAMHYRLNVLSARLPWIHWLVEWQTPDGKRHQSAIAKNDLTVISAGICLDGEDRRFDLGGASSSDRIGCESLLLVAPGCRKWVLLDIEFIRTPVFRWRI